MTILIINVIAYDCDYILNNNTQNHVNNAYHTNPNVILSLY